MKSLEATRQTPSFPGQVAMTWGNRVEYDRCRLHFIPTYLLPLLSIDYCSSSVLPLISKTGRLPSLRQQYFTKRRANNTKRATSRLPQGCSSSLPASACGRSS